MSVCALGCQPKGPVEARRKVALKGFSCDAGSFISASCCRLSLQLHVNPNWRRSAKFSLVAIVLVMTHASNLRRSPVFKQVVAICRLKETGVKDAMGVISSPPVLGTGERLAGCQRPLLHQRREPAALSPSPPPVCRPVPRWWATRHERWSWVSVAKLVTVGRSGTHLVIEKGFCGFVCVRFAVGCCCCTG